MPDGTLTATSLWTAASDALPGGGSASGAEVAAYDAARKLVLVLGPEGVDILDAATGAPVGGIPKSAVQVPGGGAAMALGGGNSVAVSGDTVAVAFDGPEGEPNGAVAFFTLNADGSAATWERTVTGPDFSVPDHVTFTSDGGTLLVALEGEPRDDYPADPEGGIGVIDVASGALAVAGFEAFNADREDLVAAGLRLNLPGATLAEDVEPEYIAVSGDGATAYATLQEANAIAEVDIATATVTRILPLGTKDHSVEGQGIDPSDEDGATEVREVPVSGLFMPDGIASFEIGGTTYLVTANEGDGREYTVLEDEVEVQDLALDPAAFPDATTLQLPENLGRLTVSATDGDTDGDGDFDALYSFGARSFSIWEVTDAALVQTYDSGDLIEQTLFAEFPSLVDDGRSDNKGPEPEHVALGEIGGSLFAFVGLERSNAVMAFEIEGPTEASFAGLLATDGDEAPEVFSFVPAADTPDGAPLLAVPNEESGTTTTYELEAAPVSETFTLQILHASDFEAGVEAVERAPNFAAIVDALEEEVENSITLSSGDNFIPGPFTAAGTDPSVRDDIAAFYGQLLGQAEGSLAGIRNGTLAFNAADIAILNAIGVQASAIGNHEFDLGPTAFAGAFDFTASLPAAPTAATLANVTGIGALFPYLSANLEFGAEPALSGLFTPELRDAASYATTAAELSSDAGIRAEAAAKEVAPWTSIEENGETIGVLGLTTQVLASISSVGNVTVADPAGDGGVDNMDELAGILQPLVDEMAAQGIDKIILLSHLQQIANERELATKLSGVDVIIGGGSHTVFADATDPLEPGDTAGGDYPEFFTGADGKAVALVNTGANYTYVGRLVVTFDENGEIIPDSVDPDVSGANVTSEEGVDAVAGDGGGTLSQAERDAIFADGTRGGEAKQIADAVGAVITAKDSNVVGFTDVFLEGRRNLVRSEETNLGDLTSDANLAVAKSYDLTTVISLKNGGGIRAEIGAVVGQPVPELLPPQANPEAGKPEGGVSQLDIENSLRFNNGLSLITLDAQGILNAAENAVRGVAPGATPGAFPQICGLNFSFDPARAALDRVVDLAVVDQQGSVIDVIAQGGELVGDAAREFRVVTLNFLADGGDGIIVRPGQTSGTLPVYEDVAELDVVNLYDPAVTQPDFETVGREQAALADLLSALHGTPEEAFDVAETPPSEDERTQNLSAREGEVIGDGPVEGAGRDDLVVGTGLGDTITGVGGDDTVAGVDGRDLLRGNTGEDALSGGDGRDTLTGGGGDDTLVGGADADRLKGGGGDDALTGEAGADIFVFTGAVGDDTITDFAAGEDRIGLVGLGFADFAAVQTAAEDTGDGVLLTLDADTTVLIEGASLAGLQAADFVLA